MRVSPIRMADAVICYNGKHTKVDVISCILPLKNTSKTFKRRAFIHSLRFISCILFVFLSFRSQSLFLDFFFEYYLQFWFYFSRQNMAIINHDSVTTLSRVYLHFFSFFFLSNFGHAHTDNIRLFGPKWPLSYTIAAESIWLYYISRIIESIEWLHRFKCLYAPKSERNKKMYK